MGESSSMGIYPKNSGMVSGYPGARPIADGYIINAQGQSVKVSELEFPLFHKKYRWKPHKCWIVVFWAISTLKWQKTWILYAFLGTCKMKKGETQGVKKTGIPGNRPISRWFADRPWHEQSEKFATCLHSDQGGQSYTYCLLFLIPSVLTIGVSVSWSRSSPCIYGIIIASALACETYTASE